MQIAVKFSPLRHPEWHEHIGRFLLGGAITLATGLIAKHFGPVIGGLAALALWLVLSILIWRLRKLHVYWTVRR